MILFYQVALYKQDNCLIFRGIHCIAYVLYHIGTQEDFLAFADKPIETKTCDKEIVLDQIMLDDEILCNVSYQLQLLRTGHSKSSLRSSVDMTPCIEALFINAAMIRCDSGI